MKDKIFPTRDKFKDEAEKLGLDFSEPEKPKEIKKEEKEEKKPVEVKDNGFILKYLKSIADKLEKVISGFDNIPHPEKEVIIVDKNGEPVDFNKIGNYEVSSGGGSTMFFTRNTNGITINPATEEKQDDIVTAIEAIPTADVSALAKETTLQNIAGFNIPLYDYISLGYTGSNLTTVKFYLGGSGGTLLNTLTLGYDGSNNLITVTKS